MPTALGYDDSNGVVEKRTVECRNDYSWKTNFFKNGLSLLCFSKYRAIYFSASFFWPYSFVFGRWTRWIIFFSKHRNACFYSFRPLSYARLCYFWLFKEPWKLFIRCIFVSNDSSPPIQIFHIWHQKYLDVFCIEFTLKCTSTMLSIPMIHQRIWRKW